MAVTNALTIEDLEAMPDDGRRYELIGGAIVMTPAPEPVHQRVSRNVLHLLEEAFPDDEVFYAPIDLDLPFDQRVEPDLVVAPNASIGKKRLRLPVVLVVEIVSAGSTTNDRVTKRAAYAEAGIPAYWLIDLPADRIDCLRLDDAGAYQSYASGRSVDVDWPAPVRLDLDQLMAR